MLLIKIKQQDLLNDGHYRASVKDFRLGRQKRNNSLLN